MFIDLKKYRLLLLIFSLFLFIECSDDSKGDSDKDSRLTGRWESVFTDTPSGSENEVLWILEHSGDDISQIYGFKKIDEIEDFSIQGNIFSFHFFYDNNNNEISGSGIINGDRIKGSYSRASDNPEESSSSGSFSMRRSTTSTDIPFFTIPKASITIDDSINDWDEIEHLMIDKTGDSITAGADIEWVKMATNTANTQGYVLIKIANGNISQSCSYSLQVDYMGVEISCNYNITSSAWEVMFNINGSTYPDYAGTVGVLENFIEFSFKLPSKPTSGLDLKVCTYQNSPFISYDDVEFPSGFNYAYGIIE